MTGPDIKVVRSLSSGTRRKYEWTRLHFSGFWGLLTALAALVTVLPAVVAVRVEWIPFRPSYAFLVYLPCHIAGFLAWGCLQHLASVGDVFVDHPDRAERLVRRAFALGKFARALAPFVAASFALAVAAAWESPGSVALRLPDWAYLYLGVEAPNADLWVRDLRWVWGAALAGATTMLFFVAAHRFRNADLDANPVPDRQVSLSEAAKRALDQFSAAFRSLFYRGRESVWPRFGRSIVASTLAVTIVGSVWVGKHGWYDDTWPLLRMYLPALVVTNWLPDYVSLALSGWAIRKLKSSPHPWLWLALDALLTSIVAVVALVLGLYFVLRIGPTAAELFGLPQDQARLGRGCLGIEDLGTRLVIQTLKAGATLEHQRGEPNLDVSGVALFSTFLTSFWLWLHVGLSGVAHLASKFEPLRERWAARAWAGKPMLTAGAAAGVLVAVLVAVFGRPEPRRVDVLIVGGPSATHVVADYLEENGLLVATTESGKGTPPGVDHVPNILFIFEGAGFEVPGNCEPRGTLVLEGDDVGRYLGACGAGPICRLQDDACGRSASPRLCEHLCNDVRCDARPQSAVAGTRSHLGLEDEEVWKRNIVTWAKKSKAYLGWQQRYCNDQPLPTCGDR